MKKMILAAGYLAVALSAPAHAVQMNQSAALSDQAPSNSITQPEPQFTKVIDDLPLMPGLQLVTDEDVSFSSPGAGRIAETNAIGPVDIDEVYRFYKKSLPHLGWKAVNSHTYQREGEQLRIEAHANNKITLVQFSVKPLKNTQ